LVVVCKVKGVAVAVAVVVVAVTGGGGVAGLFLVDRTCNVF
jgi:hypothetical protein